MDTILDPARPVAFNPSRHQFVEGDAKLGGRRAILGQAVLARLPMGIDGELYRHVAALHLSRTLAAMGSFSPMA
ncbi:hypothetical protein [Skermanella pratensis]|uniref:hypothetical protein n=1 Tax=Skermanella pratensis TaxID=2233999 RepID=UPI00178851AA|nr:hypothetical protein [Skermanella pratensis]